MYNQIDATILKSEMDLKTADASRIVFFCEETWKWLSPHSVYISTFLEASEKSFNFLAVPSKKKQIHIVQEFILTTSVLDINTTLEKTHANRSNTQCLVVLHSKQSQNLLRILTIQYEIPASIVHAVKGFLMSGPYKALGVKCFAPRQWNKNSILQVGPGICA